MISSNTDKLNLRPSRLVRNLVWLLGLSFLFVSPAAEGFHRLSSEAPRVTASEENLLQLLGLAVPAESADYVANKTQFQLHTLLTEQRHPKTWNLSGIIQKDTAAGLGMLFSVDEDISVRLDRLAAEPDSLHQLGREVEQALLDHRRIYIYGCGATGRLAKQMESSFWRPFWKKIKADPVLWPKLRPHLSAEVEAELIGEMTGADRALISSLEGFEDLQLIGRLQVRDRGIEKGDVIICVTEGGETSSVIGTILAGLTQWKEASAYSAQQSRRRLYFIFNNPDDRLRPFDRSRAVLDEPGITKINLTTGPQAITGSTRLQATTIETFVLGCLLEKAVEWTLRRFLDRGEMARAGFAEDVPLGRRLGQFKTILAKVKGAGPDLARFTDLEAETYRAGRFSTIFARDGLITVFIDSTERSPTFRLYPLDTVNEPARKCWIQVWTPAPSPAEAWEAFLGRPFRGLSESFYRKPFEEEIEDPFLRAKALESLKKAGDDQQNLYDFSFADSNLTRRAPTPGDLGITVLLSSDEAGLADNGSPFLKFGELFLSQGCRLVLLETGSRAPGQPSDSIRGIIRNLGGVGHPAVILSLGLLAENDPFLLDQHIGLKMLLNAHSTAVMAKLGRVVGNTMTNVSPSNLKLIGRATFLIQSHVNDVLQRPCWTRLYGRRRPVTYAEANAVLFDALRYVQNNPREAGQTAEVALSIIRILESLRLKKAFGAERALAIVKTTGLGRYLDGFN
jgi:N-acetylmuramic acid 6-phosphate etherase